MNKISLPILLPLAVAACAVGILAFVLPLLPQTPPKGENVGYQGVVELWNVETFEGGSGSRADWLTSRAANFEMSNKGLFVHVTTLTVQQMEQKLNDGQTFDLLCFSRGVGCLVQNLLQPYTGSTADIKENLLLSGEVGGGLLALPLYCGSYCLFARTSQLPQNTQLISSALSLTYSRKVGKNIYKLQPLTVGFTAYNSPLSALAMSGGKGVVNVDQSVSQYSAYESFVANKTAVTLLGTQRDLYRLSKREADGKMEALQFAPLTGYTDLVQYLAISASCGNKLYACTQFAQYLVSQPCQQTLVNLNLFSVLQQTFYTSARYLACEQGLSKAYVPNAFGDENSVISQRQTAIATLGM